MRPATKRLPSGVSQRFCGTPCRLKHNPRRRERNRVYQERYRDKQKEQDLKDLQAAKAEFRRAGATGALEAMHVADTADLSLRRFDTLRRYEIRRYGRPRVTDLTRP
jgi:hypothetical protein